MWYVVTRFFKIYNLLTDTYHVIGKYVRNRLKSTLTQDHLSAFMLMSIEKDELTEVEYDLVIEKFPKTSSLMRKLLLYWLSIYKNSQ